MTFLEINQSFQITEKGVFGSIRFKNWIEIIGKSSAKPLYVSKI